MQQTTGCQRTKVHSSVLRLLLTIRQTVVAPQFQQAGIWLQSEVHMKQEMNGVYKTSTRGNTPKTVVYDLV